MKKFTFLFIFFFIVFITVSQNKRSDYWFFGSNAGLNFSTGTPTVVAGSQLASSEASAVMSDTLGNLLFYTDAVNVWNKNHVLMPNGTGLLGNIGSTQGAVIVPYPNKDSLYYLFTLDEIGGADGLRYSMISMNMQSGLGDVTATKNVTLSPIMTEKITAVKDPLAKRYWVAAHQWGNNVFETYLINTSGLQPVVTQAIGMAHSTSSIQNTYGQMKFSPCGNRIGCAVGYLNSIEVFNFNTTTGVISNPVNVNCGAHVYGFEFSPDGNYMYATCYDPFGTLLQWDLTSGNSTTINTSKTVLSVNDLRALQLANNGKIYVCQSFDNYLGEISNPTVAGVGCNYQDSVVALDPNFMGYMSNLGMPNFVQSFMHLPQYTCTVAIPTGIAENNKEALSLVFPNPTSNEFNLNLNDASSIKIYSANGALIDEFETAEKEKINFGKNYTQGIYLVRISNASGISTTRIVKEK